MLWETVLYHSKMTSKNPMQTAINDGTFYMPQTPDCVNSVWRQLCSKINSWHKTPCSIRAGIFSFGRLLVCEHPYVTMFANQCRH